MAKSINVIKNPRGRPATGQGDLVGVRIQPELAKLLDEWREKQDDLPGRPEAIRRLLELGLAVKVTRSKSTAQRARASDIASGAIDKMTDKGASEDDQASRKRRLLKGPEEFRQVRLDRKPKK